MKSRPSRLINSLCDRRFVVYEYKYYYYYKDKFKQLNVCEDV